MTKKKETPDGSDPRQAAVKTKVLIVDDHQLVRFGLKTMIEKEEGLVVCGEAEDTTTALQLVRKESPDLAIIDISLNGGNGLELVKQLRLTSPSLRIVMLSMHPEEMFAERALRAGALGYVSKQAPARVLVTAIRQVLDGRIYLSEEMTARMLKRVTSSSDESKPSPVEDLSDRELDVLHRLGQGLSLQQIAEQLHLSPKTVSTYRDRIRQKLELSNAAELSRYALLWLLEQH
jgi:DNA-binding NarL/FixJ family response regulator